MKRVNPIYFVFSFFLSLFISAQNRNSVTFKVDDVIPATKPLADTSFKVVIEAKLGKKLFAFHQPDNLKRLVPTYSNGLISTIHAAYDQHRPLVLSPDVIWLAICQGFSIHINEHFEKYKGDLFTNAKPKEIFVRNDSLEAKTENQKNLAWKILMNQFSDSVKVFCKNDLHALMIPKFSTTGSAEKTAYEITLLEAAKKAFFYSEGSGCGIPYIRLKGTSADWQKIYTDIENFRKFGLEDWVDNLKPILKEFVKASEGKISKEFWQKIYKVSIAYNRYHMSGWIIKFFPYVKEYYDLELKATDPEGTPNGSYRYIKNKFIRGDEYCLSTLSTENIPGGLAHIDTKWSISWNEPGDIKSMECYAGFFGIKQNKKNLELEPFITWAVCEKMGKTVEHNLYFSDDEKIREHKVFWLSEIAGKPDSLPVYNPQKNKTPENGLAELKNLVLQKIPGVKGKQAEFIVTWEGTVIQIKIGDDKTQSGDDAKLKSLLKTLPGKWKPALKKDYDMYSEEKGAMFKVNYQIVIQF
jgi:hypothetical protein